MRKALFTSSAAVALILAAPGLVTAQTTDQQQPSDQQQTQQQQPVDRQAQQQEPAQQQQQQQQAVAEQCLQDLQAFGQQLTQQGYWMTGWGQGWGWGTGWATGYGTGGAAGAARPGAVTGTTQPPGAATGEAAETAPAPGATQTGAIAPGMAGQAAGATQPWGGTGAAGGIGSPRYQIRTLYAAAQVLAHQGDEEACQAVLAQLGELSDQHMAQLQEAGIEQDEVANWRQEHLAGAVPITQLEEMGVLSMDNLTGADVRNMQDEYLGSVTDVVFDPQQGEMAYAIIARGGFLGFGEDHVAVPWEDLQVAPDLNLVVLNVAEQALENAPEVDPDASAGDSGFAQQRQQIDQFWQENRAG